MTPDLAALLVAMHMGALHPYEKVLTLVLAFGPFVVLAAVIAVRRRHEDDDVSDVEERVESASRPAPDRPTAR
ncbi:MAG TPA: hypothetical protein VFI19_03540 [Nocardioides sp.]|nr:hypothetical protein [Nocardioides sp.]